MSASKDHVLVVDDEPGVLQAMARLLNRSGYAVSVAQNGREALEILAQMETAVIICDQYMPDRSGSQVLAEAVRIRPDAFRITLTGSNDIKSVQTAINQGNVNYLLFKPWENEVLLRAVRQGVEAFHLIQENRRLAELTVHQQAQLQAQNQCLEEDVAQRTQQLLSQNSALVDLQRCAEESLRDIVGVMGSMLENFNPSLGIHSRRMAQLARYIGLQLELEKDALKDVEFAAHLHDIGKMSRLHMRSPARRTNVESDEQIDPVRDYPEMGYAVLNKITGFGNVAVGVRHQKERFDGTGTPERLAGPQIPLASRVIAVADAFDKAVFFSSGPTRIKRKTGCKILLEGEGKRFDPELVSVVLKYAQEMDNDPRAGIEVELAPSEIKEGMVLARPLHNKEGVLMLQAGARLTADSIESIRAIEETSPVLNSVFVRGMIEGSLGGESHRAMIAVDGLSNSRPRESSPPSCPSSTLSSTDTPGAKPTILIVDDSVHIGNALRRDLRRAGIDAVTTNSGWTALSMVEAGNIDAVIADLAMPAMGGEELVERLGLLAPNLPCVIMTGYATREKVVSLSKRPNVFGILVKPWDCNRLVAAVHTALNAAEAPLKSPRG